MIEEENCMGKVYQIKKNEVVAETGVWCWG